MPHNTSNRSIDIDNIRLMDFLAKVLLGGNLETFQQKPGLTNRLKVNFYKLSHPLCAPIYTECPKIADTFKYLEN